MENQQLSICQSDFLLKVTRWGAVDSASVAQWTVQRRVD
jgi:hypothetical protein